MFAGGEDPIVEYIDHPERNALLSEVQKLKFHSMA